MSQDGESVAEDAKAPHDLARSTTNMNQFMDVVDKAKDSLPPEKYSKKALFIFDRDQQPRKFCIELVDSPMFNRVIMVLILLNTAWMTLVTDPILAKKLQDDSLAARTGGAGGLTSEAAAEVANMTYDPSGPTPTDAALGGRKVMYLGHEYAAEAHSWAPIYRPFYDDCVRGTLPPCSADGVVDLIFLLAFTFEMLFKLVASGFIQHKGAYLRSGWNWIDFIVVVTGWLQLSGLNINLSAIKALRPLRAMQRVRKLRVLVQCIIAALPALGSISVILLFVCTTFGIIGTQLFMGVTRHTCFDCVGDGAYWDGEQCIGGEMASSGDICQPLCLYDDDKIVLSQATAEACDKSPLEIGEGCGPGPSFCTSLGNATLGVYRHYGPSNEFGHLPLLYWTCMPNQQCRCGESGEVDPHCTMLDNPNFGANNFDNVFWAAITMFQAITLEGWVDAMYTIIDGSGVFAFLYFVVAVLFGACIVLNLFLAVLCDNFAIAEDEPNDEGDDEEVDEEQAAGIAAKALNHNSAFRRGCLSITLSPKFMWLITGCILLNALLMCIQLDPNGRLLSKYNYQPAAVFLPVWFLNAILTFIFTFESAVKMIGLGWKVFKMDSFNNFDLVVVVFSLVDVGLDIPQVFYDVEIPLSFPASVLRTFRIIRVLKLARSFENLRIILATLLKSLGSVKYLLILMLLFILIFALLGMEFFGGRFPRPEYNYTSAYYPHVFEDQSIQKPSKNQSVWAPLQAEHVVWEDEEPTRYNFDSFGEAFLSIFVILSGENWNEIWWDAHRASWYYVGYFTTFYFLILFCTGNLIMFNLFIAILLSNFDESDEETEGEEEEEEDADGLDAVTGGTAQKSQSAIGQDGKDMPMMSYTFGGYRDPQEAELRKSGVNKISPAAGIGEDSSKEEKPQKKSQMPPPNEESGDKSCMLFSWANPIRRGAAFVVWHPYFDPVIIFLICTSSILLAFDDPRLSETNPLKVGLTSVNYFFTAVFILEMLLKIIVLGFVYSKNRSIPAYLRSGWNILDFCVVVISILTLMANTIPALEVVESLKALRTFRALRPLRLISRLEGMKQVINTLIKSLPSVSVLGVVSLLFIIIFDIIAMQLFAGKLGYCLDPLETYTGDGTYSPGYECVAKGSCPGGEWPPVHLYNLTAIGSDARTDYAAGVDLTECTCDSWPSATTCLSDFPCYDKPTTIGLLAMKDFDRDGKINDYEECMSMPKYNLTRVDSKGRLLTDLATNHPELFRGEDPAMFYQYPQWAQPGFGNFDNIFYGILLLFEVSALEGWPDVMFWVIDSDQHFQFVEPSRVELVQHTWSPVHEQWYTKEPQFASDGTRYNAPANHRSNGWAPLFYGPVFFVLWILFGAFILLNMVCGVVLDAYNRIKSEGSGTAFMSEGQAEWVATQRALIAQRPLKTANPPQSLSAYRMWAFTAVTSNIFDLGIMAVIMTNMLFMALDFYEPIQPDQPTIREVIYIANLVFLIIYVIEMLLKWTGLGFKQYFADTWNDFDFSLVLLSVFDFIMSQAGGSIFPAAVIRVLRLFRVVRILRIFKTAKSLRAILMTIILSMPALYNVTALMVLFIFIFAIFCVSFFYAVSYSDPDVVLQFPQNDGYYWFAGTSSYGDFISRHANFETFGMALLTLVRCVTGESFNGIMHDTMGPDWGDNALRCCPTCGHVVDDEAQSSCGFSANSVILFVLYCFLMSMIILALIIGVILDNFANVGSENKAVTVEHIEEFREVWLRYDPKGTFIVPSHNLLAILQQLRQPLGIADRTPALSRAQMLQFLGELDIPDHGGHIHFLETLTALSHAVCGVPVPLCDATKELKKAAQKVPRLSTLEKPAHNALTNYLVSLLQSRFRGHMMHKKRMMGELPPAPAADTGGPPGTLKTNQVAPAPP